MLLFPFPGKQTSPGKKGWLAKSVNDGYWRLISNWFINPCHDELSSPPFGAPENRVTHVHRCMPRYAYHVDIETGLLMFIMVYLYICMFVNMVKPTLYLNVIIDLHAHSGLSVDTTFCWRRIFWGTSGFWVRGSGWRTKQSTRISSKHFVLSRCQQATRSQKSQKWLGKSIGNLSIPWLKQGFPALTSFSAGNRGKNTGLL